MDDNRLAKLCGGAAPGSEVRAHLDACASCREALAALIETGGQAVAARTEAGVRPGDRMGRYQILLELGRGGMGVVFLAHDAMLDRDVAVKLLHPERTLPAARDRLLREAKALGQLSHPNVASIYDVGVHDGAVYLVMEYVRGTTLREWVVSTRPGWRAIVRAYVQAATGLAAAHARDLVHRDIKPDNLLLDATGCVKVLDFGLARQASTVQDPSRRTQRGVLTGDVLTEDGALVGTPAYMAPEQLCREDVGPAADQFALCLSLWEALYSEPAFEGRSVPRRLEAIAKGPAKVRAANVPRRIGRVLERGLQVEVADRYVSMAALIEALQPRRAGLGIVAALGVGAVALVGLVPREPACATATVATEAWTEAARADVRRRFAAHEASAQRAWQHVERRLDTQVDALREARQEACASRDVPDNLARARGECVREAERAFAAAVGVFRQQDTRSRDILRASEGLADVERCFDPARATGGAAPPTATIAAQVEARREELAELIAQGPGLGMERAMPRALALRDAARALDYGPLIAKTEFLVARWQAKSHQFERAERSAGRAYFLAVDVDDPVTAMHAAVLAMYTLSIDPARTDDALRWAEYAKAYTTRLADDNAEASRLMHLTNIIVRTDPDRAADITHEALALLLRQRRPEDLKVATFRRNVAMHDLSRGRPMDALVEIEAALDTLRDKVGPESPETMDVQVLLASAQYALEEYAAAEETLLDTIAVLERFDPPPWQLHYALDDYAQLLWTVGRVEEAAAARERSLPIARARAVPGVLEITLTSYAALLVQLDRNEEAAAAVGEAVRGLEERDPGGMIRMQALATQAQAEYACGRYHRAASIARQALAEEPGFAEGDVAEQLTQVVLAQALWALGGPERSAALPLVERARERLAAAELSGSHYLAYADAWLASIGAA
ncbi:MAG: serine/threonine-protein kinase [Myxococcota bacterium]